MSRAFAHLRVEMRASVLWVLIDRPTARNALSRATLSELATAFGDAADREDVKAAVVTGAGSDAFAAGGDLKELASCRTAEDAGELFDLASTALDTIRRFPGLTVAAINGWALGGGAELALACDYRVAASGASLGYIQSRLGISSGFGGGGDLTRLVGGTAAMRLALTADILTAEQAQEQGLVDAVAGGGETLDRCVERFLAPMLTKPPQVVRAFKSIALAATDVPANHRARAAERAAFVDTWTHDDHWAAVAATARQRAGKAG